jgi:hypothetical protein
MFERESVERKKRCVIVAILGFRSNDAVMR